MKSNKKKWEEIKAEFESVGAEDYIIQDQDKENWSGFPGGKTRYYIDLNFSDPTTANAMHCVSTAIHMLDYKYKMEVSMPDHYISGRDKIKTKFLRVTLVED